MGGMRSLAIRGGLAAVAMATLLFVWFFTAQWCSMLVDRVYTAPMTVVQSTPFGWNGTFLQFGSAIPGLVGLQGFNRGELLTGAHLLELSGPGPDYKQAASLEINANNQLILAAGGRSFVLGSRAGTIQGDDEPIPAFAAEPGDTTSVTLERSLLGWLAPFSLAGTYLSGPPTTWLVAPKPRSKHAIWRTGGRRRGRVDRPRGWPAMMALEQPDRKHRSRVGRNSRWT
jgi:hypothetical protein